MLKKIKYHIIFLVIIFFLASRINASENNSSGIFSRFIDEATIKKGYEINAFDNKFQLAVFPQVLKSPTRIELKNRTEIFLAENNKSLQLSLTRSNNENASSTDDIGSDTFILSDDMSASSTLNLTNFSALDSVASSAANVLPIDHLEQKGTQNLETAMAQAKEMGEISSGRQINSDIYEFDVRDKSAFDGKKPFIITISYIKDTNSRQQIFYFDAENKKWTALPSAILYKDKSVRSVIHLPYAKIAVFSHDEIPCVGYASWYKYKGCNCAASPDYEKGTKLKVTNLANDKSVIITVNDYGPDRKIFPDRVIDLDVDAFKIIALKSDGIAKVKVEPQDEVCTYAFDKVKHPAAAPPQIAAKYAIIIDEPTGEVMYKKDENMQTSLASITKLMTAQIFMEQNSNQDDWNKAVKYNAGDDLGGARLYVNDEETITIKDLFYSMLVGSANNAAKSLVRNSGISEKEFIKRMNQKAKEWDLKDTRFYDVSGLNPENKSTARDIAIMAKNIFKNLEMLKATTMAKYSFKTINTKKSHTIKNTNKLLADPELYITGGKTGYLEEAGECLVLKAKNENDGREVIGVIMGEETSGKKFEEMKKLVLWALE